MENELGSIEKELIKAMESEINVPPPLFVNKVPLEIYKEYLSEKALKITTTFCTNTVEELVRKEGEEWDKEFSDRFNKKLLFNRENKIEEEDNNSYERGATLCQYLQFSVEYDGTKKYDLSQYFIKVAKLFNYMVEKGIADYGMLAPMSTLNLVTLYKPEGFDTYFSAELIDGKYYHKGLGYGLPSLIFHESEDQGLRLKNSYKEYDEYVEKMKGVPLQLSEEIKERILIFLFFFPPIDFNERFNVDKSVSQMDFLNNYFGFKAIVHEGVFNNEDVWEKIDKFLEDNK